MKNFNNENELKKAYAEHLRTTCEDDFYLTRLEKIEVNTLNGGYTPMNAINLGISTKSKHIGYIPGFGYTEVV